MAKLRRGKRKRTKQTKSKEFGIIGTGTNSIGNKKPDWGKKRFGNVVQGKGTMTTEGASSSRPIVAVASGTNTQGQQNQKQKKKGPRRKLSCLGCRGKHQFKDCPQWKSVQALLAKEKKPGN